MAGIVDAETVSSAGSAWYVGSFRLCYESGICGSSFMWKAVERTVVSTVFL